MFMTIQTAAAKAGVSPGTLRNYERAGLLTPQRSSSGHRLFTSADVEIARRIAAEHRARWGFARHGAKP